MAAAESLLKSGEVSAMIRQGFISSPTSSAAGARLSPKFSSPSSSPPSLSTAAAAAAMHPSPPSSSLPSPKASTLFEMISQEDLSRRVPPPPPSSSEQKRRRLEERISKVLSTEGTRWGPADVELSVSSSDGFRFSMAVHRRVLASRSRFFAEKLEGIVGTLGSPVVVEICECDDVEVYVEAVAMMYCRDLRLSGKEVGMVLGLLKVSMDIMFDAGVRACLDYLEVVPWSEDEEEKVVSVLSQLQLHELPNGILQRVSVEPSTSSSADTIFFRVLAGVLQAKDEKARREMKALLSGLLREGKDQSKNYGHKIDVSRETLYHFCKKCLNSLHMCLSEAANADEGRRDRGTIMAEIAREADNIQWLVEILINKRMCDEFVTLWADETELASCHSKIPCMYRYEISRITAQLCIAIGKGHLLVSKDARISLLRTWLEALYEDFGWMKRACRIFDKKMVEDGLCQTILTLPMAQQQTILLRWFDCFLNKGDDCPNMQRAFEVWWRRAFVRQYAGNQDLSGLQIAV
ncbi:BTB/POZ domain-containing protein At5g60050 [Elaeis guineensis]|uniref:BTB/POZ domain-containing protein At5g60050 n=1 Tax=Elaeis guineensis var. tenera TaxID=51953 RepID=A0A6I9RFI8_ELAGV|nr:BTB/POZ domain-containing protein At5g60050 [Elaeis guineensis]XP_029120640.1 BTB/POZ domain-containing protein At5g60050 [Elaeis guineensis]